MNRLIIKRFYHTIMIVNPTDSNSGLTEFIISVIGWYLTLFRRKYFL